MRLFAAIRPPAELVRAAADAVDAATAGMDGTRLRRPPIEQWHLTVAFYGEVAEGVVPELTERLGRAAGRTPAIELELRRAGAFPRRRAAQVLWLGVHQPDARLSRLAERGTAAGRRCGIAMEDRRFTPHLTVARLRPPADVTAVVERLAGWVGGGWRVTELELVRSHLGPQVRHEVIERLPLAVAGEPYQA